MEHNADEANPWKASVNEPQPYPAKVVYYISIVYFLAVVLWLLIIVVIDLYDTGIFGWLILLTPLLVFIVSYYSLSDITYQTEDYIFQADFTAISLIIALPLLTWMSKNYQGDMHVFSSVIVMAMILTMLSFFDFWVARDTLSVIRHIQSIFETMAVTLLIFAFYLYYDSISRDEGIFA